MFLGAPERAAGQKAGRPAVVGVVFAVAKVGPRNLELRPTRAATVSGRGCAMGRQSNMGAEVWSRDGCAGRKVRKNVRHVGA